MTDTHTARIFPADGDRDIETARELFEGYANWLDRDHGISLSFQGIEEELATLPGKYAPPTGHIYLGAVSGVALGCAAFRPFESETCEIKRLYVRPEGRGTGLGAKLVEATLEGARAAGYRRAVLDTAGFMTDAQALYARFGFTEIAPYYNNPLPGVRYMAASLTGPMP